MRRNAMIQSVHYRMINIRKRQPSIKGVNLGGWLVLEKWMTPSLFKDTDAVDEFTFCDTASKARLKKLEQFRKTWITEADFEWLASHDIQAVRIPVGYWIFGDEPPYVGAIDLLDKAFVWAHKHGLKVLVCLHGAPGSQNGNDHSGRIGGIGWGRDDDSVERTLRTMQKLVERYKDDQALLGFELLNEPSPTLSGWLLRRYYRQAYKLVRRHCGPRIWVVFSDCFQLRRWSWSLHWPWYRRAYLDTHQYQVFSPEDKALDLDGHLALTARVGRQLRRLAAHRPVIVGEWSAALDPQSMTGLGEAAKKRAYQRFRAAQARAYGMTDGWFYWSYRTEQGGPWSYRHQIEDL